MPGLVIPPISEISRLFIHIVIFWLAYELNAILGLFIHSFIIDNPDFYKGIRMFEIKNFDQARIPFTPIDSVEFFAPRAAVRKQRRNEDQRKVTLLEAFRGLQGSCRTSSKTRSSTGQIRGRRSHCLNLLRRAGLP